MVNESLSGKQPAMPSRGELACDVQLRAWIRDYAVTLKATTLKTNQGLIENHLIPYFGSRPVDEITEGDLLRFIEDRIASGLASKTIRNALGVLRHVYNLLESEGALMRNPAKNIGSLLSKVANAQATETKQVDSWSRQEVEVLLAETREHEPEFGPFLVTLFSTGMRRGEAMGLQWTDVNFDEGFFTVRRSVGTEGESTPKNGRARHSRYESMPTRFERTKATSHSPTSMSRDGPIRPNWMKTKTAKCLTMRKDWHAGRDSRARCGAAAPRDERPAQLAHNPRPQVRRHLRLRPQESVVVHFQ